MSLQPSSKYTPCVLRTCDVKDVNIGSNDLITDWLPTHVSALGPLEAYYYVL
jgi:hypothetical protein